MDTYIICLVFVRRAKKTTSADSSVRIARETANCRNSPMHIFTGDSKNLTDP